jgi:hypothetical protein
MQQFAFGSGRQPQIKLIGINTPFEPHLQLGHEFRAEDESRSAQRHTTFEPLNHPHSTSNPLLQSSPVRQQTILSHRFSPELQRQLRSGFQTITNTPKYAPSIERIVMGTPAVNTTLHYPSQQRRATTVTTPSPMGLSIRQVSHVY